MAVQLKRLNNLNLLDLSSWQVGQSGVSGFSINGLSSENARVYDTGPYGQTVLVWGTYPSGDNGADGGWNTDNVTIDRTKTYRWSVWVRRTSDTTGGQMYLGCHTNGTNDTVRLQTGGNETNPYWHYDNIGIFTKNQWYLVVGHMFPAGTAITTATHPNSGIWTKNGGKVYANRGNVPYDVAFPTDATAAMHRTYHFYCGDSTSRLQFYSPRIEVVDANAPTIEHLLTVDLTSPTVYPEAIVYSDTTTQAGSSDDVTSENGELISISSYTSSGTYTWARPVNCTQVLVKVVGGGGGAAGYCESGGGGGYAEKLINVENINTVTVTVGGGGSNTGYYAAAGDGGTSSFGGYCSASGGYGANRNYSHTGGHGGVGSNGDINLYGGSGTGHSNGMGTSATSRGGSTYLGGASGFNRPNNAAAVGPGAPGTGAPGGRTDTAWYGPYGQPGAVIVWEYK